MTGHESFLVTTVPRLLFWALLTPLLISSSGIVCTPTGDTRLASLEVEVFGENRIAFDSAVRVYDVGIPEGVTTVTVRADAMDTQARLTWYVPDGDGMLASGTIGVGSGQVTVDLPPDGFSLYVGVFPPGRAVNTYIMTFVSCTNDCGDGNECTADVCDPDNGTCSNPDEMEGVACAFGVLPGVCAAGMCEDAMLCAGVDCSDGLECTTDLCDPADGTCADHTIETDGTACDFDGFPGICELGTCEDAMLCAGVDCSDGLECTTDLCDRADGSCFYANETEGTACDFGGFPGMCELGACLDAMLCVGVDCSDGQECTTDVCDPADGGCYYTDLADGTSCDLVGGNGFCSGGLCVCIPDGGPELCDGVDNDCNGLVDDQGGVASVTVSPDFWDANRIGHRQQLTATALNACGNPIPGSQSTWVSSNYNVARVDASGLVTAVSSGMAVVTGTADGKDATTTLTVTSQVESAVLDLCWATGLGEAECRAELADTLYTVWFARSDDAPALLVDGELKVAKDMYCLQIPDNVWKVCPTAANFPPDADFESELSNNDTNFHDEFPNPPDPTTPWSYPNVAKFQWDGDRIGVLSDMSEGLGTFRVLDRHEEWTVLALGNASHFQLEGKRIGWVVDDGIVSTVRVKDGIFSDPSNIDSRAAGGVRQFEMKNEYIAVLYDNGLFIVKQGINAPWHVLSNPNSGVTKFAMAIVGGDSAVRMGRVVTDNAGASTVWLKEAITAGNWTAMETQPVGVRQFEMKGDYIGVLYDNGLFRYRQGIAGTWRGTGSGVTEFAMEIMDDDEVRIGQLFDTGDFQVKDGIDGPWTLVSAGVKRIQLQEDYIGALLVDGTLRIKEGIFGEWRNTTEAYGPGVTQFRLAVDVPVPPERTTPLIHAAKVAKCTADNAEPGHRCFPNRTDFMEITDYYGYFAGGEQPLPGEWDWAIENGPMDPMDALTLHHDAAYEVPMWSTWYPESKLVPNVHLCVVRYGLEYAKLTRGGTPIPISETNDPADWPGLEDLYRTIYVGAALNVGSFWTGSTVGCPDLNPSGVRDSQVEKFAENTKAKHNLSTCENLKGMGEGCALDTACCSDVCYEATCSTCQPSGKLCLLDNDSTCCSGVCGFPSGLNPVLRCDACKPTGIACLAGNDDACCSGFCVQGLCREFDCKGNGAVCLAGDDSSCCGGVCNALLCAEPYSLPNYAPCTRNVACQSGVCGLEGGPNAGLCGLPLLALCSTHAQCRNGNCARLPFGLGDLRCRVL